MVTTIQKWGNSQGVRISKALLENANLEIGDEVDVDVNEGVLVLTPVRQVRGKYKLKDIG